jgi:hypothetical protein
VTLTIGRAARLPGRAASPPDLEEYAMRHLIPGSPGEFFTAFVEGLKVIVSPFFRPSARTA